MPHVDDHTLRSRSPHPHHHQQQQHQQQHHTDRDERASASRHHSYYHDKRGRAEGELSPYVSRHEAYSPNHWRYDDHHSMDSTSGSRNSAYQDGAANGTGNTPPPSPHIPPRYDYSSSAYPENHPSSYYPPPPAHGGPPVPPYSRGGGYSYYHHHPNSRPPPMMPRDMHYHPYHPDMPPPPYHQGPYPPPHPHGMPPPRFETPPLTPTSTTSYYHDQQYPNFLPPSASITTSGSSGSTMSPREAGAEDDYYYGGSEGHHGSTPGPNEVNQVGQHDVLCGRGAPTNYHPGNEFFRDLVKEYQSTYLSSKRADKPFVASHIVNIIQSRGGRFLRRYKRNGVSWERGHFVWVEVDPQKAYEKACQALREGAPELRKKLAGTGSSTFSDAEDDATTVDDRKQPSTPNRKERDSSASTSHADERIQDAGEAERDGSAGSSKKPAAAGSSQDDRNDELQSSERS
ncbi:expressed unknown protein [Seminavis robusta]|uniref:DUF6824 domain-containing protein n=1 Tax=Seminavis robusta TaxID=568900 RepID=A0A9N8HWZ4_9STRA|nr:expressed unknown protein [Seminavis robusta]|eukprot:Sro1723_g293630.1 n/a (458) ;mRNA; f:8219-9687